jgi:predicted aspartyl protease
MGRSDITRRLTLTGGVALATQGRALAQDHPPPPLSQPPSPPSSSVPALPATQPDARTVNFTFEHNQATVNVYVNKKGPLRFLMDSGAAIFAIQDKAAQALGLPTHGSTMLEGAAGGKSEWIYRTDEVLIGETVLAKGLDLTGTSVDMGPDIIGVLPLIILPQCQVDFVNRKVTAHLTRVPNPTDMAMMTLVNPKHAELRPEKRPIFAASLDGVPIRVLLDTGFTDILTLTGMFVRRQKLWDAYGPGTTRKLQTATGETRTRVVTCKSFKIAGANLGAIPIEMADPNIVTVGDISAFNAEIYDAVVGMEILRRFDLWVDGIQGAYGMRPNAMFNDVVRRDRSGLQIGYAGPADQVARVLAVTAGSAGDLAGLKVNDQVLAFAGDAPGNDLSDLHWALSGRPGSKVTIKVSRDGAEQTLIVVLDDPK